MTSRIWLDILKHMGKKPEYSIWACRLVIGVGVICFARANAWAGESFQALSVQNDRLYGEPLKVSDEAKINYMSRGQEYLRDFLRQQMLSTMQLTYLTTEENGFQPGAEFTLENFYPWEGFPLKARCRIYANEDINRYLRCGRFLPLAVEMNSDYQLLEQLKLSAKMEAPLDNLLRLRLGSQINWSSSMFSLLQYQVSNGTRMYDGVTMGLGWNVATWRWNWNYEITPELIQVQHMSLTKEF